MCNVCDFGTNGSQADLRMATHFSEHHPSMSLSWTDNTKEMANKIVPVEETDGCFIVAATGDKGEVVEVVAEPENRKRNIYVSSSSPAKKARLDTVDSQCPVDLNAVIVQGKYLSKVREATKNGKRIHGCVECMEIFDRKDKVVYHIQQKKGI